MEEPRCESAPEDKRPSPPEKRGDLFLIRLFLLQRKTLFGSGGAAFVPKVLLFLLRQGVQDVNVQGSK